MQLSALSPAKLLCSQPSSTPHRARATQPVHTAQPTRATHAARATRVQAAQPDRLSKPSPTPAPDPKTVCVYGSLLPGLRNDDLLTSARALGPCKTAPAYTMYDMANMHGFPAVCTRGKTSVQGMLYEVDARTLDALDHLEGHPRRYERQQIALEEPHEQQAWIYILPRKKVEWGSRPVAGGDWRAHLRRVSAPQRPAWLPPTTRK